MPSRRDNAAVRATAFAALGDETRLALLAKLAGGEPQSISALTAGTKLTRQAVTKHLRVLERVRIVHARRLGRERLFELNPQPVRELAQFLEAASARWDSALARLKSFVEEGKAGSDDDPYFCD
jgi:DNA-binding transcriptional ArsR family regulator